jgi:hypothetical protein
MQRARLAQPSAAKRARAKQLNSPQGRSDLSSQRMQFFPLRSVKGLVLCPHGGSDHHRACWELVGVVYAKALVRYLAEPGLELTKFFRRVRDHVLAETSGRQRPFEYGSLTGEDLFFRPVVK